jgi:5'-nucleotidase
LSLDVPQSGIWNFRLAAELCLPIVAEIFANGLPAWSALNVNVPNVPQDLVKGVKLTRHGLSGFKGRFRLEGTMVFRDSDPDLDAVALKGGWVSVTPLGLGMLHAKAHKEVSEWKIFK